MFRTAAPDLAQRTVFLCGAEGFMSQARTLLSGLEVPNSCRGGVCGSCRSLLEVGKLSSGDTEGLDEGDRRGGWFLACCSYPATDLDVAL